MDEITQEWKMGTGCIAADPPFPKTLPLFKGEYLMGEGVLHFSISNFKSTISWLLAFLYSCIPAYLHTDIPKLIPAPPAAQWLKDARHTIHITILAAITLVIGMYLVSTMVLIARDGVLYIEIAQKMDVNITDAVRGASEHPGYPFLIYVMHQAVGLFYGADSLQGWIISAQTISLLSKLIATIALYFVGSYFVGSRFSFWGVLILSLLPDAMDFGADALTDWPSLMFLSIGFLLLLLGVEYRKYWMWGLAGIAAGLGYLIRPECGQIAFYGGIWLAYNLIRPQGEMRRGQAAGALVLLAAGFAVIALPYMQSKGYILPEQRMWKLPMQLKIHSENLCLAGVSVEKLIGNAAIINNLCETLVYYFIPFLAIGAVYYFRRHPKTSAQTFFITAFIIVNVARAIWQPIVFGFLSRRHTLPLVAFTIFFIPMGLQIISCWLSGKNVWNKLSEREDAQCWFFILMFAGISICGVKLVRMAPLRWEKQGYRDAAIWLNQNTEPNAIIAVPDKRIAFYAERKGQVYSEKIPKRAAYIVTIAGRKEGKEVVFNREIKEVYSTEMSRKKKDEKVVIYHAVSQPSE